MRKKKNISFLIMCMLFVFCFADCSQTEPDTETDAAHTVTRANESDATETETQAEIVGTPEEILAAVDWDSEHIECTLTDRFAIDADVPTKSAYEGEFGLFGYTLNDMGLNEGLDSEGVLEMSRGLAKTGDALTGGTVADNFKNYEEREAELEEKGDNSGLEALTDAFLRSLCWTSKYRWQYDLGLSRGDYSDWQSPRTYNLRKHYPYYISGRYDENLITQRAEEVAETFTEYIFFDEYTYECATVDGELCSDIMEFYDRFGWSFETSVFHQYSENMDTRYEITLYPVIDRGICLMNNYNPYSTSWYNDVIFYLNSDYEIYYVAGENDLLVDDSAYAYTEIMSLQDILLQFYNDCDAKENITVLKVRLCYAARGGEEEQESYLEPCWWIQYACSDVVNGDADNTAYWAVTGEKIYNGC
ncbi:MAG: hypothetical protein LUE29_05005 [Lachnospiraceae bacterium]|nr:hypothetical protein [Lachnospiraceae bacterium]